MLAVLIPASISSVSASAASMQSLRLTSRCVTTRTASGPNAPTRTPRALSRAASSPAPFPACQTENDDVGFDRIEIDRHAFGVRQRFGQQPRVGVIFGEAASVLLRAQSVPQRPARPPASCRRPMLCGRRARAPSMLPNPPASIPPARPIPSTSKTSPCRIRASAPSHPRPAPRRR